MSESTKTDISKSAMLQALVASLGVISTACDAVGIHALITPSFSQITCVLAIPSSAHSFAYSASTKLILPSNSGHAAK